MTRDCLEVPVSSALFGMILGTLLTCTGAPATAQTRGPGGGGGYEDGGGHLLDEQDPRAQDPRPVFTDGVDKPATRDNPMEDAVLSVRLHALASSIDDEFILHWTFDLGGILWGALDVGVGVGGGGAQVATGCRGAMWYVPRVEAFWFPWSFLQLYARVGVELQHRFGAELDHSFSVAPWGAPGLRLVAQDFIMDDFVTTFGVETRFAYVASGGLLVPSRVLPTGALSWSTGANIGIVF